MGSIGENPAVIGLAVTNAPSNFSVLPGLICTWNDVYELCAKTFFEGKFMCAPS